MRQIVLWQVAGDGPKKLNRGRIDLEEYLEEWIERDPGLLQVGLTIVGRQIGVEGGTLDLLALDPQGRWVAIEIKRGVVGRNAIAQALDYASSIASMPYEELSEKVNVYLSTQGTSLEALLEELGGEVNAEHEARDTVMFVVGTGRHGGIERMVDYLSGQFDVPINVVSYEVFEIEAGRPILVRELTESEARPPRRATLTVTEICAGADGAGIGKDFRTILEAAQRHGLYARPWRNAITYTPPFNRARALLSANAWTRADGLLGLWVGSEAFAEFYSVTAETAMSILGPQGWRRMTTSDVEEFVANLDRLFESMEEEGQDTQS